MNTFWTEHQAMVMFLTAMVLTALTRVKPAADLAKKYPFIAWMVVVAQAILPDVIQAMQGRKPTAAQPSNDNGTAS